TRRVPTPQRSRPHPPPAAPPRPRRSPDRASPGSLPRRRLWPPASPDEVPSRTFPFLTEPLPDRLPVGGGIVPARPFVGVQPIQAGQPVPLSSLRVPVRYFQQLRVHQPLQQILGLIRADRQ